MDHSEGQVPPAKLCLFRTEIPDYNDDEWESDSEGEWENLDDEYVDDEDTDDEDMELSDDGIEEDEEDEAEAEVEPVVDYQLRECLSLATRCDLQLLIANSPSKSCPTKWEKTRQRDKDLLSLCNRWNRTLRDFFFTTKDVSSAPSPTVDVSFEYYSCCQF